MSANDVVGTLTRGLKEFHLDDSELDDRTVIGESELVLAWLTAARKEEADRQGVDAKGGEKEKAAFSGEDRGPVGLTKGAARGAGAARARQRV